MNISGSCQVQAATRSDISCTRQSALAIIRSGYASHRDGAMCRCRLTARTLAPRLLPVAPPEMAERVGFEPTWGGYAPIRFRVGAVMTASVPLRGPRIL